MVQTAVPTLFRLRRDVARAGEGPLGVHLPLRAGAPEKAHADDAVGGEVGFRQGARHGQFGERVPAARAPDERFGADRLRDELVRDGQGRIEDEVQLPGLEGREEVGRQGTKVEGHLGRRLKEPAQRRPDEAVDRVVDAADPDRALQGRRMECGMREELPVAHEHPADRFVELLRAVRGRHPVGHAHEELVIEHEAQLRENAARRGDADVHLLGGARETSAVIDRLEETHHVDVEVGETHVVILETAPPGGRPL